MKAIAANDYSLPVGRPIALRDLPGMERKRWSCVAEYPSERPAGPFCAGHGFKLEGGDGNPYSGDGRCETCDAAASITTLWFSTRISTGDSTEHLRSRTATVPGPLQGFAR
jgi:hypothetical protein